MQVVQVCSEHYELASLTILMGAWVERTRYSDQGTQLIWD